SFDEAVIESIDYCIENGIMAGYLKAHSSEVHNMLFTEYNLEDDKQVSFDEGKAEGIAEGEAKGKVETARNLKAENIPFEIISKATDLSIDEIENL
ncbi:MAG: hypothetical protein LBN36_00885, partial [Clostridiales Family XIII bacterium]|nr:hypothetical protein [Clostridiales Family XIII bacterium]